MDGEENCNINRAKTSAHLVNSVQLVFIGLGKNSSFRHFLIQFYVPFKIISAHMRRANQ